MWRAAVAPGVSQCKAQSSSCVPLFHLLAVGAALLQDSLDTTLRDPKEASRFSGTRCYWNDALDRLAAQLPKSAVTVAIAATLAKAQQKGNKKGYYRSASDFEEAMRTIRNTISLVRF